MSVKVPGAVRPLIGFPALLREHGFAIAPEQTVSFLQAVELLGPRTHRACAQGRGRDACAASRAAGAL